MYDGKVYINHKAITLKDDLYEIPAITMRLQTDIFVVVILVKLLLTYSIVSLIVQIMANLEDV